MNNDRREAFIEELKEYIMNGELTTTDNLNETIYKIDDIQISGDFDSGIRGTDHNVLLIGDDDWHDILEWGTVIVPENKQYISDVPVSELDELGFDSVPLNDNHIIKKPDLGQQASQQSLKNQKLKNTAQAKNQSKKTPTLSEQYKKLKNKVENQNTNQQENKENKKQLKEVRKKISEQTQKSLQKFTNDNPDLKKPKEQKQPTIQR